MIAHAHVLIIGGGPVGSTLALSLRDSGLSVVMLEARREFAQDSRTLALSYNSRLIFEQLGVWQQLKNLNRIESVHVSQRDSFGTVRLRAEEVGLPALGYTLNYGELRRALDSTLAQSAIPILSGAQVLRRESVSAYSAAYFTLHGVEHTMTTNLLAIADGGAGGNATAHDYQERAIVTEVRTDTAPAATAFERFRAAGTIALLPKPDSWALIWSAGSRKADELIAASDDEFLRELEQCFSERLGRFTEVKPRASFPLVARAAPATTRNRMVWLGNAAQTLHPVMAQGLNLGLRDAFELGREIARAQPEEIGSEHMLARYRARRMRDRQAAMFATNSVARLFSLDLLPSRFATALGLNALNSLPFAKRFFIRRAIFGI
ncbi:MAG TPA: FAD-dependent monooxygenase [Burkholderiales bacterium]|nr:FAD-dependent monooxygenase [Burkholderiales bacterium]